MWEIIANIASICSIIGLPIALWQIYGLKSKVEATEKGIKSVLDIKEHEKLNQIFHILVKQYEEIGELICQINKTGKSKQTITNKCKSVNKEINFCIVAIPPQYTEILKNFRRVIEHIEKFMESDMQNNAELKESRDYLNNAIQQMKQEQKVFDDKAISIAAHSND